MSYVNLLKVFFQDTRLAEVDFTKVREAIKIKTLQPTINRHQGFDLPAIYSEILPVSVTRDRSRQTSGHPAQTIGAVASSSLRMEM